MSIYLTKNIFEQNLNTKFWLADDRADSYPIDLVEIANEHSSARQEQFALRFRGDSNQVLPQRIYPIKHNSIGEFELFLVPISRDATGTFYEAVFNRLIEVEDQA
jgi:hypothetical protein